MSNTQSQYEEAQLASFWNMKFKNAMVAKSEYTKKWNRYIDAYDGKYFKKKNNPEYKSDFVSNYIFSIIETIRPIMLDNDPKFQAIPRQPEGLKYSNDWHEGLSYEFDREKMNPKLYSELIRSLTIGTSVWFLPWDSDEKNVKAVPFNAFNLFPDPLATSPDDAEYLIYATYKHDELLRRKHPKHADRLRGGDINYGELVNENNDNGARIDNQILVLEVWCRDWTTIDVEENGKKDKKQKYPNGRVITLCPEINVILSDKKNPYKDGKFPFKLLKDYDIPGKFWGEGEVAQLLSPQTYINELTNAIIDNAKHTANMPWIIDKNSGIGVGKITDRPGLVIRKNPGSEVKRDQPPSMPAYIGNMVDTIKGDMEQVSGVFDTLKGNSETGVYTAQGILALQEAGQARVRLKVKLLESFLGELATLWCSRITQFWGEDRWIRVTKPDGSYDYKMMQKGFKEYDYDVKITAGSTMMMNRGAMLDLMIRLAQTQMSDGEGLVDREAVIHFLPQEVKSSLMNRMKDKNVKLEELQQQVEEMTEKSDSTDEETMGVVEQMLSAIEQLNNQILQLQKDHDKLMEEKKEEEKINQTKEKAYNEGYKDAEGLASQEESVDIPDEILEGLEDLSDEELELVLQNNPQLASLFT